MSLLRPPHRGSDCASLYHPPTVRLQRVGLLGGSFNPPHYGHLALAQAALVQLSLNQVNLMPAGQPWQKMANPKIVLAAASHRLALCQLAIQGIAGLGLEPCEIERAGNTYTVDTLLALRQNNLHTEYTLIIGADQAQRLETWHDWQTLLSLCRLAIVARAGQQGCLTPNVQAVNPVVDYIELPTIPISSTLIRDSLARLSLNKRLALLEDLLNNNKNINNNINININNIFSNLPPTVAGYILQHNLY